MSEEFEAVAAAAGIEPVDAYVEALLSYADALAFRVGYFYGDYVRNALLCFCQKNTLADHGGHVQLTRSQAADQLGNMDMSALQEAVVRLGLHASAPAATAMPAINVHVRDILKGDGKAVVPLQGYTLANLDVIPGTLEVADRRAKASNICVLR